MKKSFRGAKRVYTLRDKRGETQIQFAKILGVSQASISSWEKGEKQPSPAKFMVLGLLAAAFPELSNDRNWFWQQAGNYQLAMTAAFEQIMKERSAPLLDTEVIRIPFVRYGVHGSEDLGLLFPLRPELVPNPGSTQCILVDEKTPSHMFLPRDLIILDTSGKNAKDLRPFWNKVVLVNVDLSVGDSRSFDNRLTWGKLPNGLSMGRLRYKELWDGEAAKRMPSGFDSVPVRCWVATLGPLGDRDTRWEAEDEAFRVGLWHPTGVKLSSMEEARSLEDERGKQAPAEIRLDDGCEILGCVLGWFRPPQKAA